MNGYTLTGADMTAWNGQRVQIVGSVVPPNTSAGANASAMPVFRVQTVQPITGPCPQQ